MKILPTVIKDHGFTRNQIKRVNNLAIYECTKGKTTKFWEVIKIQSHNGYELAGVKIEPAETYPSSSQWGTNGFTHNTIESAERKFRQLQTIQSLQCFA